MSYNLYKRKVFVIFGEMVLFCDLIYTNYNHEYVLRLLNNNSIKYYSYNEVLEKNNIYYIEDNIIGNDILKIKGDKLLLNNKTFTLCKNNHVEDYMILLNAYTKTKSGNGFVYTIKAEEDPNVYLYISGLYENFDGGYFVILSNFYLGRCNLIFYNIYHGKYKRIKAISKYKNKNNKIYLKFKDLYNIYTINIVNINYKKYPCERNTHDTIYSYLSVNQNVSILIKDFTFKNIFNGQSLKNVIDMRNYL